MDRGAQQNVMQGRLSGSPIVTSTQVPKDRTKGSGTALTQILCGVFAHHMIGRVGVAEFATSTQGDTPFTTDQTWMRVIQHMDAGVRYEDAFIQCDQIVNG
jgi:HK97 family phage major capsid protein